MELRNLGNTDLKVSSLCLGTMTFGEQNTQQEAHAQLDYAIDHDINFIDTAEMYPVPPKKETYAKTEEIIGKWSKLQLQRDKLVLATKIAGPGMDYIRDGSLKFNKSHMVKAVEDSLQRLNTDYIDLYQLHWPERTTNYFGNLGYIHNSDEHFTPILERLEVMKELKDAGKVLHFGLSNETPWGVMKYLELADRYNLPRIVSIQNPYNLLNRTYEVGLAEVGHRENCGLLAYSPLGFGTLSGKYLNNQKPVGARLTVYERFTRYNNAQALTAIEKYCALAQEIGVKPSTLALSYVTSRPFVTSNIIGATKLEQLKENIDSINFKMTKEIESEINKIHTLVPNPCP